VRGGEGRGGGVGGGGGRDTRQGGSGDIRAKYIKLKTGDLLVLILASQETYIGANKKMTYVGSGGSQMWSDGGVGVWSRVEGAGVGGRWRDDEKRQTSGWGQPPLLLYVSVPPRSAAERRCRNVAVSSRRAAERRRRCVAVLEGGGCTHRACNRRGARMPCRDVRGLVTPGSSVAQS